MNIADIFWALEECGILLNIFNIPSWKQAIMKRPGGWVVSAPDTRSQSRRFESCWRRSSAPDCIATFAQSLSVQGSILALANLLNAG